jgi:hypothetical protein
LSFPSEIIKTPAFVPSLHHFQPAPQRVFHLWDRLYLDSRPHGHNSQFREYLIGSKNFRRYPTPSSCIVFSWVIRARNNSPVKPSLFGIKRFKRTITSSLTSKLRHLCDKIIGQKCLQSRPTLLRHTVHPHVFCRFEYEGTQIKSDLLRIIGQPAI